MGQIPNKTYTAPDGSVYRVEADGSVTKIKEGRVQSNEPPSKYNITPDGKIYRVESDGSVTYLGNAEDHQYSTHDDAPTTDTKESRRKWIGGFLLAVIVAVAIWIYVSNQNYSTYDDNNYSSTEQYSSTEGSYYENPTQSTEYIEQQNNSSSNEVSSEGKMLSEEDKELDHVFYPGDIQGEFSGIIEGLGTIHGSWGCGSEMGGGSYYFDSQGAECVRELNYVIYDPLVWYESIDHGTEHEETGVWYFDYFNGTKELIATGTYVRSLDNQRFSFTLYRE